MTGATGLAVWPTVGGVAFPLPYAIRSGVDLLPLGEVVLGYFGRDMNRLDGLGTPCALLDMCVSGCIVSGRAVNRALMTPNRDASPSERLIAHSDRHPLQRSRDR